MLGKGQGEISLNKCFSLSARVDPALPDSVNALLTWQPTLALLGCRNASLISQSVNNGILTLNPDDCPTLCHST